MKAFFTLVTGVLYLSIFAAAAEKPLAPDFPPGLFSDGKTYSLRDFEGQVVVLIFYDAECPKYRASIPERSRLIDLYRGKPIRFFAIAGGDTIAEAKAYAAATKHGMIAFADNISLMERSFGAGVSRNNGMQIRVIGADGRLLPLRELSPDGLDTAVDEARFKYKGQGYDSKLDSAIDCLEAGQYAEGLKLLKPMLRNSRKETADSAQKLHNTVKEEVQAWLTRAAEKTESDPCQAFDLYQKAAAAFPGDEIARRAQDGLKKLATNPQVKDELAARQMWQRLAVGIIQAKVQQRSEIKDYAAEIARRYSKTPTGEKAAEIVKQLM